MPVEEPITLNCIKREDIHKYFRTDIYINCRILLLIAFRSQKFGKVLYKRDSNFSFKRVGEGGLFWYRQGQFCTDFKHVVIF